MSKNSDMNAVMAQVAIFKQIRAKCPHAFNELLTWQFGKLGGINARMQILNEAKFQQWCMGFPMRSVYDFFDGAHLYIAITVDDNTERTENSGREFQGVLYDDKQEIIKFPLEKNRVLAELNVFVGAFEYYENYLQTIKVKEATDGKSEK